MKNEHENKNENERRKDEKQETNLPSKHAMHALRSSHRERVQCELAIVFELEEPD